MAEITVYGANWCPDCRRAKQFLGEQRVPYQWIDLDANPQAKAIVEERNRGAAVIPTIVFPDGSHLAEPSNEELAAKLGLRLRADREAFDLVIVGGAHRPVRGDLRSARGYRSPGAGPQRARGPGRCHRADRQLSRVPKRRRGQGTSRAPSRARPTL